MTSTYYFILRYYYQKLVSAGNDLLLGQVLNFTGFDKKVNDDHLRKF